MKTHHHPKLKTTQCPLFSCGFFGQCTQTVLSPTTPNPPPLPSPSPPPSLPPSTIAPPPPPPPQTDSESSSSNTSQSFTQWRFSHSPITTHFYNTSSSPQPHDSVQDSGEPITGSDQPPPLSPPPVIIRDLKELFHVAELQLSTGSDTERVQAIHMLEHSLVLPNLNGGACMTCPAAVMTWILNYLKVPHLAKSAAKILLTLCLTEGSRHMAVEEGAVGKVVEALADLEGSAAERALAALELLCMVAEGAAELRTHALVVPMMVEIMKRMEGTRGKEYAISVLAVIFSGSGDRVAYAPPEEVARAVLLALQGDCSARGRRKGTQLLKILQDHGRLELTQEGD